MDNIFSDEQHIDALTFPNGNFLKEGFFDCPFCKVKRSGYNAHSLTTFRNDGFDCAPTIVECHSCSRTSIYLIKRKGIKTTSRVANQFNDLNHKIGDLVSEGLLVKVQQMLDSVRVIGNNAVHPGVIDFSNMDDAKTLAINILKMINLIVQYEITNAKALEDTYDMLTDGQKAGIAQRDSH